MDMSVALIATRALLFAPHCTQDSSSSSSCSQQLLMPEVVEAIHGVAVWCLASEEGHQVEYHIDYAELFRYETGIVHTPILAGTCHISPIKDGGMEGGDFMANKLGYEHYKKFGYKANLMSFEALEEDISLHPEHWVRIPFHSNRGIIHQGSLPHLSTRITRLPEDSLSGKKLKRVILGLNCFVGEAVGICCQRAPEHSDAFNRTVRLYQSLSSSLRGADKDDPFNYNQGNVVKKEQGNEDHKEARMKKKSVSVRDVLQNKALAKLLVLAARKKKCNVDQMNDNDNTMYSNKRKE